MLDAIVVSVVGGLAILVILVTRAKKWDILTAHARDSVRHALAAILMLGTLAGTVWTMSGGAIVLQGNAELIVSTGSVALALEAAILYTAWYIGQLDMRILLGRNKDEKAQMARRRRGLIRWFYSTVTVSAVANFAFRATLLHNGWLAAFVAVVPIMLINLLLIQLRALPEDYEQKAKQAVHRGMVLLMEDAQQTLHGVLRHRGTMLTEAEAQRTGLALHLLGAYATATEQGAFHRAVQSVAGGVSGDVIDSTGVEMWTSAEVAERYSVTERTAQHWIAQCPGRHRIEGRGNRFAAPAHEIRRLKGKPPEPVIKLVAPARARTVGEDRRMTGEDMRTIAEDRRTIAEDMRTIGEDEAKVGV